MKKKGLLLVVALLALSGLMASMAYSRAMVSNSISVAHVETDKALLAVVENDSFKDFAKINEKGVMVIDFTKMQQSGFQRDSEYDFDDLFYVKNNLDVPIKMGMRFYCVYKGDPVPHGLWQISTNKACDLTQDHYQNALLHAYGGHCCGWYEKRYITLQPDEQVGIDWLFRVSDPSTKDLIQNFTLQIFAETTR